MNGTMLLQLFTEFFRKYRCQERPVVFVTLDGLVYRPSVARPSADGKRTELVIVEA